MGKYHRLTHEERYQIEALVKSGATIRAIGRLLKRDPGAISRELRRNRAGKNYLAHVAGCRTRTRRKHVGPRPKVAGALGLLVEEKLAVDWSPEQISGRFERQGVAQISHETIYKFIYADFRSGGKLWKSLRRRHRLRRTRFSTRKEQNQGKRLNRTWIDDRPKIVERRERLGDFERDTVEGKRSGSLLVTMVDRKSRLSRIRWIDKKSAIKAHQATLSGLKDLDVKTITNDNGAEFADHEITADDLGVKIYFSHPYASWQRGTNENTNGLIRQYFPKGTEPTEELAEKIETLLNERPRKCLGFKTPNEVHQVKSGVALSV